MRANQDIRLKINAAGIRQWQVADAYGIHEQNFSRLLRKELTPIVRERVLAIIKQLEEAKLIER
jgi:predicted XRE-type DNA-binding protein